jgi:hypothetical protein
VSVLEQFHAGFAEIIGPDDITVTDQIVPVNTRFNIRIPYEKVTVSAIEHLMYSMYTFVSGSIEHTVVPMSGLKWTGTVSAGVLSHYSSNDLVLRASYMQQDVGSTTVELNTVMQEGVDVWDVQELSDVRGVQFTTAQFEPLTVRLPFAFLRKMLFNPVPNPTLAGDVAVARQPVAVFDFYYLTVAEGVQSTNVAITYKGVCPPFLLRRQMGDDWRVSCYRPPVGYLVTTANKASSDAFSYSFDNLVTA